MIGNRLFDDIDEGIEIQLSQYINGYFYISNLSQLFAAQSVNGDASVMRALLNLKVQDIWLRVGYTKMPRDNCAYILS